MDKYIIKYDAGFGVVYEVVEANSIDDADNMAYEMWKEEAESNADYGVVADYTEVTAEEYGV